MILPAFLRRLIRSVSGHRDDPAARSSTPLRRSCTDVVSVPPAAALERLAVPGRHVVLQFPSSCKADKESLISRLRPLLPDHSVFDSGPGPGGTTCVTVLKVIDERVVLGSLPLFLAAIRDFSDTADRLCRGLAAAHRFGPEELLARGEEIEEGRVDGWSYYFHGQECCFTGQETGQVVDVQLKFGDEFGVLDPYFLSRFIRTTPAHREAARLLRDNFHDACRVLEVLHARGHLRVDKVLCDVLGGAVIGPLVLDRRKEGP
jgi:hypothetical protein